MTTATLKAAPAAVSPARSVVMIEGGSPTIMRAVEKDYRTKIVEDASFINSPAGSYVRRWTSDGGSQQSFGHWTGSRGGALHWNDDAHTAEDKARQIARDMRIPFLDEAGFEAWKATRCAEVHPGDVFLVDEEGEWHDASGYDPVPHPARSMHLVYRDASGTYEILKGCPTQDELTRRKGDVAYTMRKDGRDHARVLRPWADSDRATALAQALHAALAEEHRREDDEEARADAEVGQPPSCL